MSTTELLVEYLILGSLADIWLFLTLSLVLGVQPYWTQVRDLAEKLSPVIAVTFLSVTYTLGGLVHFLAQSLFDRFQKKYRNKVFKQKVGQPYRKVRSLVYHYASSDMMARFRSDGHIIRISRGNILNFSLLAISLLLYINKHPIQAGIGIGLSIIFAVLSYLQWVRRYKAYYRAVMDEYLIVKAGHGKTTIRG